MSARAEVVAASIDERFRSRLREPRTAAILGAVLGVTFSVCFITGLFSHLAQHPVSWLPWPARPAGLYRVTQGVHTLTGVVSIPVLMAKLWVVFPKLFEWPPIRSAAHGLERLMILPLVAGSLFLLFSGTANLARWYPWQFFFPAAHYQAAWIATGAMVIHLGAKWSTARRSLRRRSGTGDDDGASIERRLFLGGTAAISAMLFLATAGNTVRPLSRVAVLAQRRPGVGPQGVPVNKSAASARVLDAISDPEYRLTVERPDGSEVSFTLDQLRGMPQREAELPIACVEGWSTSAMWRGVGVGDLLAAADVAPGGRAEVVSLQQGSRYGRAPLGPQEIEDRDTLLALELNGEPLHVDHGFPVRLIGPNRPGVLQTKWISRVVAW